MRNTQRGFTLIELMIAVVVVAILASIAYPTYRDYVRRGYVPEATAALGQGRIAMEQWFQDNRTYVGAPCPANTPRFTFACTTTANTFTITATGQGVMNGFSYSINEANTRSSNTPWGNNATCWVIRAGGQC